MSEITTGRPSGGRHPVNVAHLVMGLAFVGLVAVWALVQSGAVDDDAIRWLLPVPWVLAGGAGLLASVLGARRHVERRTGWVPPTGTAGEDPLDRSDEQPLDQPLDQPATELSEEPTDDDRRS